MNDDLVYLSREVFEDYLEIMHSSQELLSIIDAAVKFEYKLPKVLIDEANKLRKVLERLK